MLIFEQLRKKDPRLRLLALVIACGFLVLFAGLWWVQIVSVREYQAKLETQSSRTVRIPAARGKILDRQGLALAENRPSYNVSVYIEELREQFRKEYARIRPVNVVTNSHPFWKTWLGSSQVETQYVKLKPGQISDLIWQARSNVASNIVQEVGLRLGQSLPFDPAHFRRHYEARLALPYPVAQNIDAVQVARFQEHSIALTGVELDVQSTRYYPYQTTASHVLGYLLHDPSSREGEEAFFSYRLPDYRGLVGIEAGFDRHLRGKAGAKSVLVNNLGFRQSENVWLPAEPGYNVVLTIDLAIQQAAERSVQQRAGVNARGAVVVMDVQNGDILALASLPALNPNHFIFGFPPADRARLDDPKLRLQINRATQENYAPGSIFKIVSGLAALEAGLNPHQEIYNPGYFSFGPGRRPIHDTAPAGLYDFRRALKLSSNTYFITNGLKAGMENIVKIGQQLHLGERAGLPTRQETSGIFPSMKTVRSGWSAGDTANICIGQGKVSVTPLQMAVMTASIANGGKVLWPRLVERLEPQDPLSGEQPIRFPSRVRNDLGVKTRNLEIVRDAMLANVEETDGSGHQAFLPGFRIGGKTGTAEVADAQNQKVDKTTWFASFGPYEQPRYAVIVMIESGASGGKACAPIARDVFLALQRRELGAAPVATSH